MSKAGKRVRIAANADILSGFKKKVYKDTYEKVVKFFAPAGNNGATERRLMVPPGTSKEALRPDGVIEIDDPMRLPRNWRSG